MTFLQLRNLSLYSLDDLNGTYFTSTQVNVWLNNAQREVQKQLLQAGENYYVQRWQTTLVVNQTDYVLPTDFVKLHRLEIVMSGLAPNEEISLVEPITINQQDLFPNGASTPAGYYIKKNRLVLCPPPDTALVMRMYYSPLVADMSLDADVPDVPTEYQEYIAVLAILEGLFKDGREAGPFLEKKKYYLELMKHNASNRREDQPRGIVVTNSDGFESLF